MKIIDSLPIIKRQKIKLTDESIPFNYMLSYTGDRSKCFVHYYIHDYQFERVWRNPNKYIPIISKHAFMISPEFSVFTDSGIIQNLYNTYRNREIGSYMQANGINVIPSVCFGDYDTFDFAFSGIEKGSCVSFETNGYRKNRGNLFYNKLFYDGIDEMIKIIQPEAIIVYGDLPPDIKHDNIIHIEPFIRKRLRKI